MIRLLKYILILLVTLLAATWVLLRFEPIQQKIIALLEKTAFKATGMHIELSHVSLGFPASIAVHNIKLKDSTKALFLEVSRADLKFDVKQILEWQPPTIAIDLQKAKIYSIPEQQFTIIPEIKMPSESSFKIPEIILNVRELEIDPQLFRKFEIPTSVELNSLSLTNLRVRHINEAIEVTGEASLAIYFEKKPARLNTQFTFLPDKSIQATYEAIYNNVLPLKGKLELSPELDLEGSTLNLPLTDVVAFKSMIEGFDDYHGTIQVDGALNGKLTSPEIKLEIKSPSLMIKDLLSKNVLILLKATKTEAEGVLKLTSLINGTDLPINAELSWLYNQGLSISSRGIFFENISIADIDLQLSSIDNPDIHLIAGKVVYKDLQLENLDVKTTLNAGMNGNQFSLKATGNTGQSPLGINAEGLWSVNNDVWNITLGVLEGTAVKFPFRITESMKIIKDSAKLSIDPIAVNFAEGSLNGSFQTDDREVRGTLSLKDLPIASLPQSLHKLPIHGKLSLEATISGSASQPEIKIAVNTEDFFIHDEAYAKIKSSVGEVKIRLGENILSFNGIFKTPDSPPVDFKLQFPMEFSFNPWVLNIADEAPLSGSLSAQGEIAPILHSMLENPTSFSGNTNVHLNIEGTVADPMLKGTVDITNGSYEIPEIGVLLKDLTAQIVANGPWLEIRTIAASDGKGGHVSGTGYYHIDKAKNNPFALEFNLEEATLLNQDYVQVVCNGPLTFKGDSEGGSIIAKLVVSKASITIPDRSFSTINTVEVSFVNIPKDARQPEFLIAKKSSWPLSLDINLNAGKSVSIKGRDLASTWKGELTLKGSARAPQLFGELRINEGQYLFNGNPFAINQGTITFAGELDKKTSLYVIASKDLDRVKVDVIAKGAIRNPAITFRSNPPMPQREILSWILFGRGTSEISSFQGAQLSESITNLSTNQEGPDVLSKIRSTLKIDRFEIGKSSNDENSGMNVEVGKYVSDNVLISVIKSDVNKIAVEAALTDRIKLQAQVGDDSQGKMLLRWKKDY